MYFSIGVESRKVDFCSEPEEWNKLISIVIEYNAADFVKGLLILATLVGRMKMKGSWMMR